MKPTYTYVPLSSPRHTRVLFLEPSSDYAAPLCCRISETSLDNLAENGSASYDALSYSWDAQSPSREILCDGGALLVTPNCEAAMRRMRSDSKPRELWIDSICINQSAEAVEERNSQVALMGEIYKSASMVTIWLGDDDAKFKLLAERLRPILHWTHPMYHPNEFGLTWDLEAMMKSTVEGLELMEKDIHSLADDPLATLFERSWFSRMWVVQEATLSFAKCNLVLCGESIIPWMSIQYLSEAMERSGSVVWHRWRKAMRLQRFLAELVFSARAGSTATNYDMTYILGSAREKQSGDPRDKIFALFGVFRELDMPLPAPDYGKPLATVYREATAACIAYDKHLGVLYYVPSRQRREGLPSWVPDWSTSGHDRFRLGYGPIIPDVYWNPSAGGVGPSQWRLSVHPSPSLFVRGRVVDSISKLGKLLVGDDETFHRIKYGTKGQEDREQFDGLLSDASVVFQDWLELTQELDHPAGEATREAFRQTLFKEWPQQLTEHAPRDIYNRWCAIISRSLGSREIGALLKEPVYLCHLMAMMGNMQTRLFLTQNGTMGTACKIGPVTLEPGDKVVVIDGLEVPFLLRPVPEGGYKVVTHAFVYGIMHGESYGEGGQESEEIQLV